MKQAYYDTQEDTSMKRPLLTMTGFLCLGVPALAQPPAAQPPSQPPCLQQINIYSFDAVPGNRSLVVTDRAHRRYRINFMGICSGLQFNMGLAFRTRGTSNLSCIAKGDSVLHRDPAGPPECVIKSVEWQTPALDKADAEAKVARNR